MGWVEAEDFSDDFVNFFRNIPLVAFDNRHDHNERTSHYRFGKDCDG